MRRGRVTSVAGALLAAVLVAGCGRVVAGRARPVPEEPSGFGGDGRGRAAPVGTVVGSLSGLPCQRAAALATKAIGLLGGTPPRGRAPRRR